MINDLELSDIGNEDLDQLTSKIETYYKNDTSSKTILAYHWEKNHLFLDGQQWLVYDGSRDAGGSWRLLRPQAANEYIPRPVTNYIFDAFQTLKSYLLKNKPRSTVRPNTQTHRDKSAAKLAELVVACNYSRLKEAYNFEYAASCLITYGTVFKKDYWDSSYTNQVKIPRMEQRPVNDPNTGMPTGQTEEVQAVDPMTGYPIFDELPLGDVQTSIVEPFRMMLDPLAVNLHDARWIMEYSIRPLTWIVENYDKDEPGYTGRATEVKEEKSLSSSMRRFYQLRTSTGVKAFQSGITSNSEGSSQMIDNAAIVKEYYERPTAKYPKGRLIVVANSVPLYASDSPYEGPELGDWHPYSECRWELFPGRFWGRSPFDDATEIQRTINTIDSVIILTRKTMAIPQKMVPHGSIPLGQWTGQPGQTVFAKPGPNGEMPTTIPAAGVDAQVWQEREQRLADFKQITGAVDILKGDRPPGVTAASALSLLFEVGTGKLFPVLDRWKSFVENSEKKQLRLVANKFREPREDFINMLLMENKELTEDQIKKFLGEDLHDNCNVVIEASSSIPRLKAAEQALLLELAQIGVLNLNDPSNKQEFLERFGVMGFDSDYSRDEKRAEWENDNLDNLVNSPDDKPVVLEVDDHAVHRAIHSARMKEPSYMSQPAQVQQAYMQHVLEHQQMEMQQQQEQMMQQMTQQMAMNTPPGSGGAMPPVASGQPQGTAAIPPEHIRKGPGIDNRTKQRLMSDLTGPAAGVAK